jgi:hypothetical protein
LLASSFFASCAAEEFASCNQLSPGSELPVFAVSQEGAPDLVPEQGLTQAVVTTSDPEELLFAES